MKFYMIASLSLFVASTIQSAEIELEGNLLKKEQIEKINTRLEEWTNEEAKKQKLTRDQYLRRLSKDQVSLNNLVKETNKTLSELRVPKIRKIATSQYKIAQENGFAGPNIKGFSFLDGKHLFCFPCEVEFNNFSYGIFPGKKLKLPTKKNGTLKVDLKQSGKPTPIEGSPDPK